MFSSRTEYFSLKPIAGGKINTENMVEHKTDNRSGWFISFLVTCSLEFLLFFISTHLMKAVSLGIQTKETCFILSGSHLDIQICGRK